MKHTMSPEFCADVRRIEVGFKDCRKLLNAVGDENRQHYSDKTIAMINMLTEQFPQVRFFRLPMSRNISVLERTILKSDISSLSIDPRKVAGMLRSFWMSCSKTFIMDRPLSVRLKMNCFLQKGMI